MEDNPTPDTSNFLDWVEIKNFKSIKDLRLDCKRVNIFIGKPNVGKSNILEALGMLGAELFDEKFMNGSVRYKNIKHLFYQNNSDEPIRVGTNISRATLSRRNNSKNNYELLIDKVHEKNFFIKGSDASIAKESGEESWLADHRLSTNIADDGIINEKSYNTQSQNELIFLKKYDFSGITEFIDSFSKFLLPNGENLFEIIDRRKDLKNEFGKLFLEQGLDLVLDQENQSFSIQRKDGFYIYKYDYYTIADTFRRFMFYIAAIESNKNSVLIFEEPEVHSFPPYTQDVAYRMIYSETNQFFVSTHSPYLLQTLVENLTDDQLSVFVTYYENYETKVKALTPEELSFVQEYSTDIFFNLDRFIPNAQSTSAA